MDESVGAVEEGGKEGGIFSMCCSCFDSIFSCLLTICCCFLIPIIVVVLVWNFVIRASGEVVEQGGPVLDDFTHVLDGLTDVQWPDVLAQEPTVGEPGELNAWRTRSAEQILQLELYNALDESWQDIFQVSADDWEESEVLSLTTTDVAVDRECAFVDGVMKVCNANYGDTGWVGINEVQLLDGFITASVAKMNEYYLRNADYEKRRYTMCHELGHGFGLSHTDEDPYNADLGNCLDYTDSPGNNMYPGEVNFERLRELYGTHGQGTDAPQEANNGDGVTSSTLTALTEEQQKGAGDGNRRGLRRVVVRRYLTLVDES